MGHDHGASTAAGAQRGRLTLVLGITVTVLAAEVIGGVLAHSLVLIADAGHMAADAAGIGLSLLAVWFAGRPASETRTFGYQRAEILAAVVNAVLLFGVGAFILIEAARRLVHPETSRCSLTSRLAGSLPVAIGVGRSKREAEGGDGEREVLDRAQQPDRRGEEPDADHGQSDAEVDDHVEAGQHVGATLGWRGGGDLGDPGQEHEPLSESGDRGRDQQQRERGRSTGDCEQDQPSSEQAEPDGLCRGGWSAVGGDLRDHRAGNHDRHRATAKHEVGAVGEAGVGRRFR